MRCTRSSTKSAGRNSKDTKVSEPANGIKIVGSSTSFGKREKLARGSEGTARYAADGYGFRWATYDSEDNGGSNWKVQHADDSTMEPK